MTRKEALEELIAMVEAGEFDAPTYFNRFIDIAEKALPFSVSEVNALAWMAYKEHSLDAAKALHEAVLPGWDWCVIPGGASIYSSIDGKPFDADIDDPARAWLLAILRALLAQEPSE